MHPRGAEMYTVQRLPPGRKHVRYGGRGRASGHIALSACRRLPMGPQNARGGYVVALQG